jgi:hypothetical protein
MSPSRHTGVCGLVRSRSFADSCAVAPGAVVETFGGINGIVEYAAAVPDS